MDANVMDLNSVDVLLGSPFRLMPAQLQRKVKEKGRDLPEVSIERNGRKLGDVWLDLTQNSARSYLLFGILSISTAVGCGVLLL